MEGLQPKSRPLGEPGEGQVDDARILARLTPPALTEPLVGTERIAGWAPAVADHLLTLIRAPCGFGKTTAAALLARGFARSHRTAWVCFDRGDNDPDLGLSYIVAALRNMGLEGLDSRDAWVSQSAAGAAITLARVAINALANLGDECFLVLDDLDVVQGEDCANFINYLLVNAPPNLHVIVTCQARPKLPLPYLLVRDALLEKSAEALRLEVTETQRLLAGHSGLTRAKVTGLHEAMEGWVTGIKLGALALANNGGAIDDIGAVVQGAHWFSEYIEDNIFNHLPAAHQDLLLRCSVAERFSPALAVRLSGAANAPAMLEQMSDQGVFLETPNASARGYRLHPAFREFLVDRLRQAGRGLEPDLNRLAAQYFAEHDQPVDAIRYAIEAKDIALALDCLEGAAMAMIERAEVTLLLQLIARLPQDAVAGRTRLMAARAWALALTGRREAVEVIEAISHRARFAEDPVGLRAELDGIRSLHAAIHEDSPAAARDLALNYLRQWPAGSGFAARSVRNIAAHCSAMAGEHVQAREILRSGGAGESGADKGFTLAYRYFVLALGYFQEGFCAEAERVSREALERCEASGGRQSASAAVIACLAAKCAYERNSLRDAAVMLRNRLTVIDEVCFPDAIMMAYRTEVGLRLIDRDTRGAAELIERAEALAREQGWERLTTSCAVLRARANLPQIIDLDAFEASVDWSEAGGIKHLSPAARMIQTLAEALIIQKFERGDLDGVERILNGAFSASTLSSVMTARFQLLRADLLVRRGCQAEADEMLLEIIRLSTRLGIVRTILDSTAVDVLLSFASSPRFEALGASEKAYFQMLVAGRSASRQGVGDSAPEAINLFDLMTKRELDILRELTRELSNKEIARRIAMTPETVKWHVRNILRKLGAESRGEAVRTAIALGLSVAS